MAKIPAETGQPGCADSDVLSRLIMLTGRIDDMIDTEGMEQDLAGVAGDIPDIMMNAPRFGETVAFFKHELQDTSTRTSAQMELLANWSKDIREQATQFLSASLAQCMVEILRAHVDDVPAPPPMPARRR